jgi:hypothetical protein
MQLYAEQPQSKPPAPESMSESTNGEKPGREAAFDHGEYKRWSDKLKAMREAPKGK